MRIEESQGSSQESNQGSTGQQNGHVPPAKSAPTAEQILGEIRDYCRQTRTAESTFGRLVVNDGKLVSRLRDGARITTGTLDRSAPISPSTCRRRLPHLPACLRPSR
jgi:hypothetical protein